jgi:hypothetical protein
MQRFWAAGQRFFWLLCAEAARLVLKLRAGARRAVRPSALGGRIKRATSTRHRGSQREGQKKAGKANLIYMACAAPVWCSSYMLCTHTKMERMVCVQIHRTQTGQKAGT